MVNIPKDFDVVMCIDVKQKTKLQKKFFPTLFSSCYGWKKVQDQTHRTGKGKEKGENMGN